VNIEARLTEIHDLLRNQGKLLRAEGREFYTTTEVAELTAYKEWTIRQACNKNRVQGHKGDDGRWRIPHEEVMRIQEEGLPAV